MKRFGTMNLVLVLMLMLPVSAWAQRDTRETREGSKLIGLAMTKQTHEERAEFYQQAMTHLRQAMQQDAENARVWLLAGTALAGLGEMQEADRAFDQALKLNPEYAEEISTERFDAWIASFQQGLEALENEQSAEAIRHLEAAELIHGGRPEAQMYLGVLYANHANDFPKAEEAFRASLEATRGPLFAELNEEDQAEWISMRASLLQNIEQMVMMVGVTHFQEQRYDEAAKSFKELTELNPHSRDSWFNYSQAMLAEAQRIGASVDTMTEEAEAAAAKQRLVEAYAELERVAKKTQEMDPNNEDLYLLIANSHRMRGEYTGDEEAGSQAAYAALQALDAIPVAVDEVNIVPGEGSAQITGVVRNRKLAAGTPVTLTFTFVDQQGQSVGEQAITITAPDAEAEARFEGTITLQGNIAGWKYTVASS
jgi:tetratricopeptide (TPR) repeat protein